MSVAILCQCEEAYALSVCIFVFVVDSVGSLHLMIALYTSFLLRVMRDAVPCVDPFLKSATCNILFCSLLLLSPHICFQLTDRLSLTANNYKLIQ